jgi:hypothetical protein
MCFVSFCFSENSRPVTCLCSAASSQSPPIVRLPIGRRDIPQPVLLLTRQIHIPVFTALAPRRQGLLLECFAGECKG